MLNLLSNLVETLPRHPSAWCYFVLISALFCTSSSKNFHV